MKIIKLVINAIIKGFASSAKADQNIWKVIIVVGLLTQGCATMQSYQKPSFKASHAYTTNYNTIWNACLKAVDDETIAQQDKAHGQIVTQPTQKFDMLSGGNETTYSTIKISRVNNAFTIRVMVRRSIKSSGAKVGFIMKEGLVNEYSDSAKEHKLLETIDELISQGSAL